MATYSGKEFTKSISIGIAIGEAAIITFVLLLFDGGYQGGLESLSMPVWSIVFGAFITLVFALPSSLLINSILKREPNPIKTTVYSLAISFCLSCVGYLVMGKDTLLVSPLESIFGYTLLLFVPIVTLSFLRRIRVDRGPVSPE